MAGAIGDGPGRGLTPRGWGFTHICWLLTSSGEPGGLVTGCWSHTAGTHRPVRLGTGPTEKLPDHTARRLAHHCVPHPTPGHTVCTAPPLDTLCSYSDEA